ncbi:Uma2 family endonuclease [Chloroflexi bacterium TSY]|nr:Uma2 family endonuclease [Chloroflexi bacterium TSY]
MTLAIDERNLLTQLLRSPRLPQLVRELEIIIDEEANRRKAFYNQITEGDKAEFINGEIIFHSPVKHRHNDASSNLHLLLKAHVARHKLGYGEIISTLLSGKRKEMR